MGWILKKPRIFPHIRPHLHKKSPRKLGKPRLPRPIKKLRS